MNSDRFSVARRPRAQLDPTQCLIWIGIPLAWVVLLVAIVVRVFL
jgi:hypothetical protein